MTDNLILALAFGAGSLLGMFFFGGLWWTVQKGLQSNRPGLWFLSSMLLRTGITLAGFYWLAADHWQRLLVCLLGFILARFIVIRLTRFKPAISHQPTEE